VCVRACVREGPLLTRPQRRHCEVCRHVLPIYICNAVRASINVALEAALLADLSCLIEHQRQSAQFSERCSTALGQDRLIRWPCERSLCPCLLVRMRGVTCPGVAWVNTCNVVGARTSMMVATALDCLVAALSLDNLSNPDRAAFRTVSSSVRSRITSALSCCRAA
jgi:hypothetical protein